MALSKEEILTADGHPALLDRLAIATPRGQLMAMLGLGGELYVAPYDRAQMRLDLLEVQEDYYHRFKNHLDRCRFPSKDKPDGQIITLKGENPFSMIREVMGQWPVDRAYENNVFKRYVHPDFKRNAGSVTPWASVSFVAAERKDELSSHDFYLPVGDGQGGLHFDILRECMLTWATRLKPAHGQAGFTVILEIGAISGEPYTYATLQRYPGLDIHETIAFSDETSGVFNRIKSINWLTVLGDHILEELAGLDAARKALEPECTLHPYPGGVLIQAGPVPQLGDSFTGLIPEAYRKVARFTRPVRFEAYQSSLFRVFEPMVGREEAVKWVRRFD